MAGPRVPREALSTQSLPSWCGRPTLAVNTLFLLVDSPGALPMLLRYPIVLGLFVTLSGCTVVTDYGEDASVDGSTLADVGPGDAPQTDVPNLPKDTHQDVGKVDVAGADTLVDTLVDTAMMELPNDAVVDDVAPLSDVLLDAIDASVLDIAEDTPPTDAGPAPQVSALFGVRGRVHVLEFYAQGPAAVVGTSVSVRFHDKVPPMIQTLVLEDGFCQLFLLLGETCEGACAAGEVCTHAGLCEAKAALVSAGDVTISALSSILVVPSPEATYTVQGNLDPANIFDPDTIVQVNAAGAEVPAWSALVPGATDITFPGIGLVQLIGSDVKDLAWQPASDGSTVEFILRVGAVDAPPMGLIHCVAPDSLGVVTLSAEMVAQFPMSPANPQGQHPSLIRRVQRTIVATPEGPVDIATMSQANLLVTHTP